MKRGEKDMSYNVSEENANAYREKYGIVDDAVDVTLEDLEEISDVEDL